MVETVVDLETRRGRSGGGGPGGPGDPTEGLLQRVALTLNSTLDLKEVLHALAEMALEATDADRCSLFLLEADALEPAVAIGRVPDEDLWAAFQQMGPIDIDEIPDAYAYMLEGRAVPVENATRSGLIPQDWVEAFAIESAILAPLQAVGEPCGVLALDYRHPRGFEAEELELVEALTSYAGVAVRNARLYEQAQLRARVHEALAGGARALSSHHSPTEIVHTLVDGYTDLLRARVCAIGLFDERIQRITTIAARGATGTRGPIPLSQVPAHIVDRLTAEWTEQLRPVAFEADPWFGEVAGAPDVEVARHLVIPLAVKGLPRGAVLLGFDARTRLTAEEREAAVGLASIAAATLERADLLEELEQHVRRLEILYGITTALVDGADADALVEQLNGLLSSHGIEVTGLALRDRDLARQLGAERPAAADRPALRRDAGPVELDDGTLAVPMRLADRVVGVLRARARGLDEQDRSLLEAVARGVAEVASRGALRASLEDSAREQAVATERERIAGELHDSVGQLFVAIGLQSRQAIEQLPSDSPWAEKLRRLAELADGGKWEIDQAIRALSFVPAEGRLVPALHDLARSFESDSGIQILVNVDGRPVELAAAAERALYRIAHEALSNAWRHARCATARVELAFADDAVTLRVRDDGVGLGAPGSRRPVGIGVASMRRTVEEVGGDLRLHNGEPRGAVVEAHVPREGR